MSYQDGRKPGIIKSCRITWWLHCSHIHNSKPWIWSYLHRFRIIESPDCPCGGGSQTTDHLLFDCASLQEDRECLIGNIARLDSWPVSKRQLGSKHIKQFIRFTSNIDFTKLWTYNLKCFHNLQFTHAMNLKTSKISVVKRVSRVLDK
jgi:hypothetical protein